MRTGAFSSDAQLEIEVKCPVGVNFLKSFWHRSSSFFRDSIDITGLAFSPSGILAVAFADRTFAILSSETTQVIDDLRETRDVPLVLGFSADGLWLAVGTQPGCLQLCSLARKQPIAEFKAHSGLIHAVAFLPSGELVSVGLERSLKIRDAESTELMTALNGHKHRVLSLAVSSDGKAIASSGIDVDIRLRRAEQQKSDF